MEKQPHTWLTTDTHLNHTKLVEWGRPADFEEKTLRGLAQNLKMGDTLIHMGDLAIGRDIEAIKRLQEAAGYIPIVLVRGNHDNKSRTWYQRSGILLVVDELVLKVNGLTCLLSHVPRPRRAGIDRNIHGHTHGNGHRFTDVESFYEAGYHVELALENSNYQPWRLDRVV